MEKNENILYSEFPLLNNCVEALKLIQKGREKEAKEKFPLEVYLLKKYLREDLADFARQLKDRVRLAGI